MKKTLTIGIPAFNEEANIGYLLQRLLTQKISNVVLEKIIVISDASTDRTVKIAASIKDKRIEVLENRERLGLHLTQNKIIENTDSDILILFDADILPKDHFVVENLVKPILKDSNIGIVGALTESYMQNSFFEKVIANSHKFKYGMYGQIRKGNNLFMCHGRGRAFSKRFYKKLLWPSAGPEDAISYLLCIKNKMKFVLEKKAVIQFRSPATFSDHKKQSIRFERDKEILESLFGKQAISDELRIDMHFFIYHLAKFLFLKPIYFVTYCTIMSFIKLLSKRESVDLTRWEVSHTSKKII